MIGKKAEIKTACSKLVFTKENGLNKDYTQKFGWVDIAFTIVTFAVLIYRITISADNYDEIINISVGYRFAVGQAPFWECREAFQTEGFILAPFLWLFMAVTKSTDGIVLFTRILYLLSMSLVGMLVYNVFKALIGKKQAFYLGYMCLFFQVHCLYYLWYDSMAYIMLTVSVLLVYYAVTYDKNIWYMYVAGIAAALMVLVYPSMILVVGVSFVILFITQIVKRKDSGIYKVVMYTVGGFTACAFVMLFIFVKSGPQNFIYGLKSILGVRSTNLADADTNFIVKILKLVYDIVNSFITVNFFVIIPTVILLVLFFKATRNDRLLLPFTVMIAVTAILNCAFTYEVKKTYVSLNNFLGYIALWAPFFYFFLKNEAPCIKNMLLYIWLPSIVTSISIALTSVYAQIGGPVKCWEAFLPAALVTLVFMLLVLKNSNKENISKLKLILQNTIKCTLIPICCTVLTIIYVVNIYGNRDYPKLTEKYNTDGIWFGIKTAEYMDNFIAFEKIVDENLMYMPSVETIAVSDYLRPIYLMAELTPLSPSVEAINWNVAPDYYDDMNKIPDVFYILPEDYVAAKDFFEENYIRYNVYDIKYTKVLVMVKKDIYTETFC